jgi:hypothetical protein
VTIGAAAPSGEAAAEDWNRPWAPLLQVSLLVAAPIRCRVQNCCALDASALIEEEGRVAASLSPCGGGALLSIDEAATRVSATSPLIEEPAATLVGLTVIGPSRLPWLRFAEGNRVGEPKLGSTVPQLTPGVFAECKGCIARCTMTDALSFWPPALSRL